LNKINKDHFKVKQACFGICISLKGLDPDPDTHIEYEFNNSIIADPDNFRVMKAGQCSILRLISGEYAVHILCDNEDIPGSPFMAQILPKEGSNLITNN